jgi:hypothetical protein
MNILNKLKSLGFKKIGVPHKEVDEYDYINKIYISSVVPDNESWEIKKGKRVLSIREYKKSEFCMFKSYIDYDLDIYINISSDVIKKIIILDKDKDSFYTFYERDINIQSESDIIELFPKSISRSIKISKII